MLDNVEQVRLMLDFGADPNYPEDNVSPLTHFKLSKDSCILLLERGADPLKKVDDKAAMSSLFPIFGDQGMTTFDLWTNTISYHFVFTEFVDIITVMLNKGVDPNQLLEQSNTILDVSFLTFDLVARINFL